MAIASSEAAFGVLLSLADSASTNITTIAELDTIEPDIEVDEAEVTHMESPERMKEFVPTTWSCTISFGGNFLPTTHESTILDNLKAGTTNLYQIAWPKLNDTVVTNRITWEFTGFWKSLRVAASANGRMELSGTMRCLPVSDSVGMNWSD